MNLAKKTNQSDLTYKDTSAFLKKISVFPDSPGVYLMKTKGGEILYIGKAKNLKARVKQYFVSSGDGRWIIPHLRAHVDVIDTLVTSSEKEALLLENTLIKKHQPKYNALLKDDKTFTALKVSTEEEWPMLSLIRYKGKIKGKGRYFGPYTSAYTARQTLDLLQKLFPLRQCSNQEFLRRTRPCILYGMGRCTAPCVGLISKEAYQKDVESVIQFLSGKKEFVLEGLKKQLEASIESLEFEKAKVIHESILGIEKMLEKQNVNKIASTFSGVALGFYQEGQTVIISELDFKEGLLEGYHHHHFESVFSTKQELLETYLLQSYLDKEVTPKEILLPFEFESQETVEELLQNKLIVPKKGDKLAIIEMADANARASYKQKVDEEEANEKVLLDLKEKLNLSKLPRKIECIDTSHISGSGAVSSLVVFQDGRAFKKGYRKYRLRETEKSDDYGALKEVLIRRFSKISDENELPDLLIIDGGKGHLNVAKSVIESFEIISCDVIGVSKEEGLHTKGVTEEKVWLQNQELPMILKKDSTILFLLQRIRDEAHRFAITYQKTLRSKEMIKTSLGALPGIGSKKERALIKAFGSVKKVMEADREALLAVKGITKKDALIILNHQTK